MKKSPGRKWRAPADQAAKTPPGRDADMPKESAARLASGSPTVHTSSAAPNAPVVTSFSIMVAHFTWFLLGPLILLLTFMSIVRAATGWLTALDLVFFVVVAAMVFGRWVEQRSGQGVTMSGEPSTWEDFRRYATWLPVLATALWIVANVLGNHWFQGNAGF
jgi:hypothetical protein